MLIILIIVLLLVFGGGGGYYGYNRWGARRRRRHWAWHSACDLAGVLHVGSCSGRAIWGKRGSPLEDRRRSGNHCSGYVM